MSSLILIRVVCINNMVGINIGRFPLHDIMPFETDMLIITNFCAVISRVRHSLKYI